MSSQSVFDFEIPDPPVVRASDPQTSVVGAHRAIRQRNGCKLKLLAVASATEPMTANELAMAVMKKFDHGLQESLRKRAMELARPEDGRLTARGTKVCEFTGSEVTAFVLSEGNGR